MKTLRPCLLSAILALATFPAPAAAGPQGGSPSPFERQFSGSLVHFMPWGDAAFARARKENLPVYAFIGSFLNELSRTTGAQSFSNPDTAAFFNAHFVCVLVDRDEHPDLAAAAQQYLDQAKQVSGWPVNLWLTPDLKPFDGSNYLGPSEEWGQQSLLQVATRAADAWRIDSKGCKRTSTTAVAVLNRPRTPAPPVDAAKLAAALQGAAQDWRAKYSAAHGGFGDAPRYPQPELLRFFLHRSPDDRDLGLSALRALAAGALRDPVNGGFFRYVTDADGRTAYPQKALVDQARLALAYLEAHQAAADPIFAQTVRGTLDYVLGHLANADGTFAASDDATGDKPVIDVRAPADGNGLMLAALARAGEVLGDGRYLEAARALGKAARLGFVGPTGDVTHFAGEGSLASPADYAGLALGFRALAHAAKDDEAGALADRLLARCGQIYLESGAGRYAACPVKLPAGVFTRAPAAIIADQNPSPESVALLAGADPSTADALDRGLARSLISGEGSSGDALLALGLISR